MKVPLSLLTSEGFVECPSRFSQQVDIPEFEDFFIHKKITGIVKPETLDDMLRSMGISHVEFHETLGLEQPPCLNYTTTIHCLLGQTCLDRAIATLGSQFECTVQVFCIRPVSQRYTDGEIYQQVSRHMGTSRLGLADMWLEHLQEGKRKHLASLLGHPQIMEAMRTVLPFAGLWDEFLLGNWAKHLAAHCDELISNYWNHISRTWTAVFKQLEHLRHLIDIQTVERLRYKAPAWSTLDRDDIGFKDRKLFPHIKKELDRVTLKRNILSLDCTIPSIRTFDENMRYLTIPAKIIERLVEVKPRREQMRKRLMPTGQATETEGQFCMIRGQHSPELAFPQLFLVAWRNFPRLSTETPLQDIKGIGMIAFVDSEEETRLCRAAYVLGFSNAKIKVKKANDLSRDCEDIDVYIEVRNRRSNQVWSYSNGYTPSTEQQRHTLIQSPSV
ncbi:hypothetical protein Focb16_v006018 [Fusarium oxysporum f. sp. cubense]|uniref:Uncharacterized protein n=1 Tax=Fusarium oxysporum f. sp. cubense TaxID=61366 RepID=A0A559LKN9_FUSOC|nr:hypothetical protein Focb16_v006018 [Fusarium oxysporum f. sp. cubense]